MTEEKKLPTIEEWFEENKNENDCAGMTVGFKSRMQSTLDDSVKAFKKAAEKDGWISIETVNYFEVARFEKKGFPIAILWQGTYNHNGIISGNESAYKIDPKLFMER